MLIETGNAAVNWRDLYRLCITFINPRPIALVSTLSRDGRANLAPFSFYNMVCANPPVIMISLGIHRDGRPKDTFVNIRDTGEFVIATVTQSIGPQMVRSACELPYGESEWPLAGLTQLAAKQVRPALVAESPVNMECTLRQIVTIGEGPGSTRVVFGDIRVLHVDDRVLAPDGTVDPRKLKTVGRLGGTWYCDVERPYEMHVPPPEEARASGA